MSLPPFLLNPQTSKLFSLHPTSTFTLLPPSHRLSPSQTLAFSRKASSLSRSSRPSRVQFSPQHRQEEFDHDDDELVVGDCVVYEEGIFEDPYLEEEKFDAVSVFPRKNSKSKVEVKGESLIPDKWKEAEAEINITKKERRKMRQEMEYGSRVEKRRQGLSPIRDVSVADYVAFRGKSLLELSPIIEEEPNFTDDDDGESRQGDSGSSTSSRRVAPRNPRWAVYGGTLDDISEIFSSGNYDSEAAQNPDGHRKLFTKEEKVLLNRRVPDLSAATSGKWQPLHTLAASGEFYLVNALLNHSVDINIQDKDGLTALHKAIISKKLPVFTDLLRESANPFVCDKEGATLMHYAVRTASSQMIKILLLHNVDINLQDNDGWTPLHLAVQTRRTDIVRLLLIKGADITLKNQDGLTPLDLCLYSGHDTTTYELIKLMKQAASQAAVAALS